MILTSARRTYENHQQGASHHPDRDPRAFGVVAPYRGALRGGGERRPNRAGGETRWAGGEASGAAAGAGDLGAEHRGDHGFDPRGQLSHVLVDSNVILDVVTDDPLWGDWSGTMLSRCADGGMLVINPIIYAEVSVGFKRIEELDEVLPAGSFRRDP